MTVIEQPAKKSSTPRSVIGDYLGEQIDKIFAGEMALRLGEDAVHATRVAIRRLRSTLRTLQPLFDTAATKHLDLELRWYADILGRARDAQVQRKRLVAAIEEIPPELVLGPVVNRIRQDLSAAEAEALADAADARTDDRYENLMAALRAWETEPRFATRGVGKKRLRKRVEKASRKARKRLWGAIEAPDSEEEMHRARKSAKRARYAAELAVPVFGKRARSTMKSHKKVQRILGEHHDSVVSAELIRTLAVRAGTAPGENGFTYGLLYAGQRRAAHLARAKVIRRSFR
ncbi:CHAD domain-containing protein [Antrihabitans sp. YC2-6]|uniref:CHAD domain-containing protein n=1 Tax=Antrihabitans sp. YC2-6 TaxID=2799498 RepID=UPI0018F61960|nr:CHAD domain-containing protein [Antrihabitans sp. YC2-6]MBJ8347821.1 CHAD domain-containing protein [Antrihabitans sp. YC2-6]